MTRLSLALCGLVLAALPSTSAIADTLTFDFSFTSTKVSGTGTFTAVSDGTDQFLIDGITGTTDDKGMASLALTPAQLKGANYLDAAMDLIASEHSRVETTYFLMSEENVKLQLQQPWMNIGTT